MTATQKIRVEACRASVLALHAAAGLASGSGADRQLLRVLRSAEALARTAVALASSVSKTTAPAPPDDAVPRNGGSRRQRRRSKKKEKVQEDVAMGEVARQPGEMLPQPASRPLDPGAVVFEPSTGNVLKAEASRERSPRRTTFMTASTSSASEVHTAASSFAANEITVITGLQARPDLANSRCRILRFDTKGGRYRVSVEGTGETIRIRPEKLQRCLFPQNFNAADGT